MDVLELENACIEGLSAFEQVEFTKPTSKELVKSLLEKTLRQIEEGFSPSEIMFTSEELVGLVKTGKFSSNQIAKFKSDHYGYAQELLSKINDVRKQGNKERYFELRLADTGEKGGSKKHHYLEIVDEEESSNTKGEKTAFKSEGIRYEAVRLPKVSIFAKPFMNIELTKWRLKLYLLTPVLIGLIAIYFLINSIITPTTQEIIFFFAFLSVSLFLFGLILPFFIVNDRKIAIAPQWMLHFSQLTGQLESMKLENFRPNGRPYRKIKFVVYEAVCPICNNTVEVYQGKRRYKGRLIGECNESPREHVFSFDHVTKKGKLLR